MNTERSPVVQRNGHTAVEVVKVRNVQNRQKLFVEGRELVVSVLVLFHAVCGAEPHVVSFGEHCPDLVGRKAVALVVVRPFVIALGGFWIFLGAAFEFCLTATSGGVVRQVTPDTEIGCNPDGALAVHGNIVYSIVGELHLFPLAERKVGETALVGCPDVARAIDGESSRIQVHDAVFLVEQAPAVLVVGALFGGEAGDSSTIDCHVKFFAVFGPDECVNLLARENLALLFEGAIAVDEKAVVRTDPKRGALLGECGHTMFAEFLVECFPALAVKTEETLRSSDPELFGQALVEDCCNGVLDDQVPRHLDFDYVGFVIGVLHVVESLHNSGVFIEAAFGSDVGADGVLDLGVALQRD